MKNNKFKSIIAVFGLCLLLMVGCKSDEPNPSNPSPPSETGGGTSEMMQEDVETPEGNVG